MGTQPLNSFRSLTLWCNFVISIFLLLYIVSFWVPNQKPCGTCNNFFWIVFCCSCELSFLCTNFEFAHTAWLFGSLIFFSYFLKLLLKSLMSYYLSASFPSISRTAGNTNNHLVSVIGIYISWYCRRMQVHTQTHTQYIYIVFQPTDFVFSRIVAMLACESSFFQGNLTEDSWVTWALWKWGLT